MGMLAEFKKFALRGNVIDMAVGVVIGGAFGKIVSSLVNDIIMPLLSLVIGKVDLTSLQITIIEATATTEGLSLHYGLFLQNVLDFLIIAFSIFMFIKLLNKTKRKKEEAAPAPQPEPTPSKEELLLSEIRDLLKGRAS
ncbi:MAG: large-conductance mechanosensitive channel protein MscL [Firmicutes bacterium]|nr:large-conductance mechanosensitive channel protein MscL [Bacillota bacterium]MDD4264074.1 large-conductance mechanosensitive channel protein MscL [Bacillota bacterium]MDD4692793.1 large-conductance mechanosensitive channel protein MscL [Bacillota bacterium]